MGEAEEETTSTKCDPKARRAAFKQIPGRLVQQNLMWAKHRYRAGSGENYTVVI
jgi:hypothetical protein